MSVTATTCARGHPLTPDNVWEYRLTNGRLTRQCKACHKARVRDRRAGIKTPRAVNRNAPKGPELEYWAAYVECPGCCVPVPAAEMKLAIVGREIKRRCNRCRGRVGK